MTVIGAVVPSAAFPPWRSSTTKLVAETTVTLPNAPQNPRPPPGRCMGAARGEAVGEARHDIPPMPPRLTAPLRPPGRPRTARAGEPAAVGAGGRAADVRVAAPQAGGGRSGAVNRGGMGGMSW